MFNLEIFMKEYKKNKKKNKSRYNKKFKIGAFILFALYNLVGIYFTYDWKGNIMFMIVLMAYITIWDTTHPIDDNE